MSTGKPAIPTVRQLDLRQLEAAMAAIRERLRVIDAGLNGAAAQGAQSLATQGQFNISIKNLQAQIDALKRRIEVLEGRGFFETVVLRADADIPDLSGVYMTSEGGCSPMDPSGPVGVFAPRGVAFVGALEGNNVTVRMFGAQEVPSAAFEPGEAVYASVGGGLTQRPNYGSFVIPLGLALTETLLFVDPDWPALRDPTAYSTQQDFIPPTYAMVADAVALLREFNSRPNGFIVKVGDNAVESRVMVGGSGTGVTIDNPDGVDSDPVFYADGGGSGPSTTNVVVLPPITVGDETTAITTGTAKLTFHMPFPFTLTNIRASLTTAQTSGSIFTVDVNQNGASILSTKLTIDNTETSSATAAVQPVLVTNALSDDATITIDVDQVGSGTAAGLKVYLIGVYGASITDAVALLLHFDGTAGGTTFLDNSVYGRSPTVNTGVVLSSTQSVFGGVSARVNGAGELVYPNTPQFDFGLGDFTVQGWFRVDSAGVHQFIWDMRSAGTPNLGTLYLQHGLLRYYVSLTDRVIFSPASNIWYFYEVSRAGGTTRVFVDGDQKLSFTDTQNYDGAKFTFFNAFSAGFAMTGYKDDTRIIKGIADHVANYTPPAMPFPNP